MGGVTLYREIDALGGTGMPAEGENWSRGYNDALSDVMAILHRRGFSEYRTPYSGVINALKPVLDDLGKPDADGWTNGYVHDTDLERLHAAIAEVDSIATAVPQISEAGIEAGARAMCDRVNGIGDYEENVAQRRAGWLPQARACLTAYFAAITAARTGAHHEA